MSIGVAGRKGCGLFRFWVRSCHPERSEGSPLPVKGARFFAPLRMTGSPGSPDCDVSHLKPEEARLFPKMHRPWSQAIPVPGIADLTQINADLRKCTQFREDSRKPMQIPASSSRTEELPSPTRKPLCEPDLHRRIRSSFPIRSGRQAALGEFRQGIEVKRLGIETGTQLARIIQGHGVLVAPVLRQPEA